jgi:hypothetical protein
MLRSFDKLRTNGGAFEFPTTLPFMVSLSNHDPTFSAACYGQQEYFNRAIASPEQFTHNETTDRLRWDR